MRLWRVIRGSGLPSGLITGVEARSARNGRPPVIVSHARDTAMTSTDEQSRSGKVPGLLEVLAAGPGPAEAARPPLPAHVRPGRRGRVRAGRGQDASGRSATMPLTCPRRYCGTARRQAAPAAPQDRRPERDPDPRAAAPHRTRGSSTASSAAGCAAWRDAGPPGRRADRDRDRRQVAARHLGGQVKLFSPPRRRGASRGTSGGVTAAAGPAFPQRPPTPDTRGRRRRNAGWASAMPWMARVDGQPVTQNGTGDWLVSA